MMIGLTSNYKLIARKGVTKNIIKDDTYLNLMEVVFNKLKISSTHLVQFGRGIGPIEMELKQVEPQYIKNLGNWKPDTQDV